LIRQWRKLVSVIELVVPSVEELVSVIELVDPSVEELVSVIELVVRQWRN